ncbi:glycosyltransferase family 2 protein [Stutzerimonas stutzeri]|uniref:glycosyltransferase family 2 protein n=1 Tax=Stutzerimonas stutzeri TaxID=316 RepID=UPI003B81D4E9
MSRHDPLISVVIPAYNYAHLLARAIESVLKQLDEQTELLVIDDGSTDTTPQVIAALLEKNPAAFRYMRKENGGAASARNLGIEESRGQYLVFLDADDELADDALALLSAHLREHPQTRVVLAGHWTISEDGKRRLHTPGTLPDDPLQRLRAYLLDKRIAVSHGASAMHREVFGLGNYPVAFRSAEDMPVFAQALANYPCSVLEQPLALIHKHADSLRHQFSHAKAGGLALADEVFAPQRLGSQFQSLKKAFYVQRCLSLFRSAWLAGDAEAAKGYFRAALKQDWRVLFNGSYVRKAIRLWIA